MDKNSSIGLILISAILLAYFVFFSPSASQLTEKNNNELVDTLNQKVNKAEASTKVAVVAGFKSSVSTTEEIFVLENNDLKVEISSIGGRLKSAVLKNQTDHNGNVLTLIDGNSYEQNILLTTKNNDIEVGLLNFKKSLEENLENVLILRAENEEGQAVIQRYDLAKEGFLLGYELTTEKINLDIDKNSKIFLRDKVIQTEKNINNNKIATTISYYTNEGSYSSLNETSTDQQKEELKNLNWITFKRKFFLFGFIANNNNIVSASIQSSPLPDTDVYVKDLKATIEITNKSIQEGKATFSYYLGNNEYNIVRNVTDGFGNNVYLGWPVINIFNKYVIIPIFNFLEGITSNYGLIIFLLVIVVKLALFPLSYKAYLSMAKIKVLKPELDEIKARVGDDMAAIQQEQMKLYSSVGVNPLSGCIPVLLQMPILLAMFNFFPNAFELRHQGFLWADDLSTYDSIMELPFSIPFGYGDHVSLFTILMTASTLLYTWYNMQMSTVTMQGPMVYVQYFMPFIFMFVLNSMSSGLTYYYFISNLITIGQQYIIKQFVNEDLIRSKLENYKNTAGTRKKSRFQQRLEDAMKSQEEVKKKKLPPPSGKRK